jgi:hypothetical protein
MAMATRRAVVAEDEEMESLRRGDVTEARAAFIRKQIVAQEEQALDEFLASHPEIAPVLANRSLLMDTARSFGGVVNHAILNLALIKVGASLAITPAAPPQPTEAEIAASERRRLVGMSVAELRDEARRTRPRPVSANEVVSPEVQALKSRADVKRLSAEQLRSLMYRDGPRTANIRRLNELLQLQEQN